MSLLPAHTDIGLVVKVGPTDSADPSRKLGPLDFKLHSGPHLLAVLVGHLLARVALYSLPLQVGLQTGWFWIKTIVDSDLFLNNGFGSESGFESEPILLVSDT